MKSVTRFLFFIPFLILIPAKSPAQELPDFRPALLTHGSHSLVNMINIESLYKRGQRDAIVMFSCGVTTLGKGYAMEVYRCSPNSELLQQEVLGRCQQVQFEPAVYHHNLTNVWIDGTISFLVLKEKPHLRIFLNQEEEDLKHGNDFVAPQFALAPGNSKFRGIYWPPGAPGHNGLATVTLDVDTSGRVSSAKTAYEYPPNLGFGAAVAAPVRDAWFIPGFRNGKIVPCRFTWPVIFFGTGLQLKSG